MSYYIWIPISILSFLLQAWLTYKNNVEGGKWLWIYTILGTLSLWPFISRYSKNLMFDALLFDLVLIVSYGIGIAYLTNVKFEINQWIGMGIMFVGIILFKVRF